MGVCFDFWRRNAGYALLGPALLLTHAFGVSASPVEEIWNSGESRELPSGFKATFVSDRTNYFLGENILLYYRIENVGSNAFGISVGGDYRGSTRADRFKVTAVSADGKPVADPTPLMRNFGGGLVPIAEIEPGGNWFENVHVIEYCLFDAPGTYTISAFHDLGFGQQRTNDPRTVTRTLQLHAPTEAEARAILTEADNAKPYHGATWGQKGEARLDYPRIRWPTYLTPLRERAQKGSETAVEGIASIRTLDASRTLVALLAHTNAALAAKAAQLLEARLPHPASDFTGPRGGEHRQFTIENAWEDSLSPPVRDYCVQRLQGTDRGDLMQAAAILRLIGTPQEVPELRRALEFAVAQTNAEYLADIQYPSPRRAADSLLGTALALQPNLDVAPKQDLSPGEFLVFLARHGRGDKVLSQQEESVFAAALEHPLAYVRMKALEALPEKIPVALEVNVTRCMTDPSVGVQNYAFLAAQRMQLPEHLDIALMVLRSAKDEWLRGNAQQLAAEFGARYEIAMAWCNHLVAPENVNDYTLHDALRHLLEMTTGRSSGGGGFYPSFTDKDAQALRGRWEVFLTDNKDAINAGTLFSNSPTGVPPDLLPSGWSLSPR